MEDLQLQNKKEQIKKKNKKTEETVTFTLLNDTIGHNKPIKYIQEEIILKKKNSEDFHQKEKKKWTNSSETSFFKKNTKDRTQVKRTKEVDEK